MAAVKGELRDVFGWFTDATGALISPSTVVLHQRTPAGVVTTPSFLTEVAPTTVSTNAGLAITGPYYRYRVNLNEAGTWKFKWDSTGTGQAAILDIDLVVADTVF